MQSPHEIMRKEEETEKILYVHVATGLPDYICKNALVHNGWDEDKAIELLSARRCEEEEDDDDRTYLEDAVNIIVKHLFECVEDLKQLGYSMEDFEFYDT